MPLVGCQVPLVTILQIYVTKLGRLKIVREFLRKSSPKKLLRLVTMALKILYHINLKLAGFFILFYLFIYFLPLVGYQEPLVVRMV